ncbi:MAG: DUF418 domain-containing protein [Pseudomonadota bacterium]|nr:DUF418 domain-containing protein [Pseudomonadota bacterium]
MTAIAAAARIGTLDILRGIAVMGILPANMVAFAMPAEASTNPLAYGNEHIRDLVSWYLSFIFIDGKMRGLFSLLFGASMLLVLDRAAESGRSPETAHFSRMWWLLVFGLVHFYFIWSGDILSLYAPVGMVAWLLHTRSPGALVGWSVALLLVQFLIFAALGAGFHAASAAAAVPNASAEAIATWAVVKGDFAPPSPAELAQVIATYRSDYLDILAYRFSEHGTLPLSSFFFFGAETLAYMLLGMAGLKSGFLAGAWPTHAYRRVALAGYGIGIPLHALLGWMLWSSGFDLVLLFDLSIIATTLVRPLMVLATAALVIFMTRNGGWLVARIAAAGRAAFTNYLGSSLVATTIFYGFGLGLFGTLSRSELWLVVLPMWVLMLLWSKFWLDRYRYGPFEWLWRTLARWEVQPMERAAG